MTTPVSPIGLADVQTEFGGVNPISLSEYYRGGIYIPASQGDGGYGLIATSGMISLGTFRNQRKGYPANITISANTTNYNIRTAALATGWNGTDPVAVNIVINSGVFVYATSTSNYGMDTGTSYPAGSTIKITNNGTIMGMGGTGGFGFGGQGKFGLPGGPAFRAQAAVSITNNGTIGGGGGGGGVGRDGVVFVQDTENGGTFPVYYTGGGGGGGRPNGVGGPGDTTGPGDDGNTGTLTAPGNGGPAGDPSAGRGGNGGNLGAAGENRPVGNSPTTAVSGDGGGGAGGAAGAAIVGIANVTFVTTGTVLGATS